MINKIPMDGNYTASKNTLSSSSGGNTVFVTQWEAKL